MNFRRRLLWLLALALLFGVLNILVVESLLGLAAGRSHVQEVGKKIPVIDQVLYFKQDSSSHRRRAAFEWLEDRLGFRADLPPEGSAGSALAVPLDWIAEENPYPPLLWQSDPNYAKSNSHFSLGYADPKNDTFQYTRYCGEADTTPSPFVPKVPTGGKGEGDYFVCYSVLLETSESSAPTFRSIYWHTYRGGSYNGFEEITLHSVLIAIEVLALITILIILRLLKKRWSAPSS